MRCVKHNPTTPHNSPYLLKAVKKSGDAVYSLMAAANTALAFRSFSTTERQVDGLCRVASPIAVIPLARPIIMKMALIFFMVSSPLCVVRASLPVDDVIAQALTYWQEVFYNQKIARYTLVSVSQ